MDRDDAVIALDLELDRAKSAHPPMQSVHEAMAVIFEELQEAWAEACKKKEERNLHQLRKELIQTAAMCIRAIEDLCLP